MPPCVRTGCQAAPAGGRARIPGGPDRVPAPSPARHGTKFLITSRDQVLAEVRPPPEAERPCRRPGALRGKIRMAPDFDALPPDMLAAMEGGEG